MLKISKNLHLISCSGVVLFMAFIYGFDPTKIIPYFFDVSVETVDLKNIFRAMMGLYLAMVAFWIIGIVNPKQWKTATITTLIFMGGLSFGRIISTILDGVSIPYTKGLVLELFFLIWGIYNLKKYQIQKT